MYLCVHQGLGIRTQAGRKAVEGGNLEGATCVNGCAAWGVSEVVAVDQVLAGDWRTSLHTHRSKHIGLAMLNVFGHSTSQARVKLCKLVTGLADREESRVG